MAAPSDRDHYREQPAAWVAALCDRGLRHPRNEDAAAVAADPVPGGRAVLVVCDGVSTSPDSDRASLAAARAARDLLVTSWPTGSSQRAGRAAALASAIATAADRANEAAAASSGTAADGAGSCTFAAAVYEAGLVAFGTVGDTRVYWVPDRGTARQLSVDDSMAELRRAIGVSRGEAEHSPQAHVITRWLGPDSPDHAPTTGSLQLTEPGWLVVCSDGLWNYASEADALQAVIVDLPGRAPAEGTGSAPAVLADALVRWACEQGGEDNITVALARHDPL